MLALEQRHGDGKSARLRRQAPDLRRQRPVQPEIDAARHLDVRRKLLRAKRWLRARACVRAHARERQAVGQQAIVGQTRGIPALARKQHARRLQRKRERGRVASRHIDELYAVHTARQRQPIGVVGAARDGVGGRAVHLYTFQHRAVAGIRQRQRDALAGVHFQCNADAIAIRRHLRLRDIRALRRAFRCLGEALAQLLQQFLRRIALRLRGRRQHESTQREQTCPKRRAARKREIRLGATEQAQDQKRQQRDQRDA